MHRARKIIFSRHRERKRDWDKTIERDNYVNVISMVTAREEVRPSKRGDIYVRMLIP